MGSKPTVVSVTLIELATGRPAPFTLQIYGMERSDLTTIPAPEELYRIFRKRGWMKLYAPSIFGIDNVGELDLMPQQTTRDVVPQRIRDELTHRPSKNLR